MSRTTHPHSSQYMAIFSKKDTMEYLSKERRGWLAHYQKTGNIAKTCREFGISRSTFYKWLKRYDSTAPSKPLRSRSKRNLTKRKLDRSEDMLILAEMNMKDPTWGAGRLAAAMRSYGYPISRATVGRLLPRIRFSCPICHGRNQHWVGGHVLNRDLQAFWLKIDERKALRDFAVAGIGK